MTQVFLPEHDDQSENSLPTEGTRRVPAIEAQEHAALVEAIRQNFPEIYQRPVVFEEGGKSSDSRVWNRTLQFPASI